MLLRKNIKAGKIRYDLYSFIFLVLFSIFFHSHAASDLEGKNTDIKVPTISANDKEVNLPILLSLIFLKSLKGFDMISQTDDKFIFLRIYLLNNLIIEQI